MKATIKVTKEYDIRYLTIDAGVLYWEDADVNGKEDCDVSDGVSVPAMPFAVKVKNKPERNPYSDHYRWQPTIDVDNKCIVDWPKGTTAHVHYKVCDDGTYTLLDPDMKEIVSVESYVPDCIGECGDYIVMDIDEDGNIDGFRFAQDDVDEIIQNGFGYNEG